MTSRDLALVCYAIGGGLLVLAVVLAVTKGC